MKEHLKNQHTWLLNTIEKNSRNMKHRVYAQKPPRTDKFRLQNNKTVKCSHKSTKKNSYLTAKTHCEHPSKNHSNSTCNTEN